MGLVWSSVMLFLSHLRHCFLLLLLPPLPKPFSSSPPQPPRPPIHPRSNPSKGYPSITPISPFFLFFIVFSVRSLNLGLFVCLFVCLFVDAEKQRCNLFKGHWIKQAGGSGMYTNWSCPTIPESKNCFKQGRKDMDFVNWRWKPDECELPRFDSMAFLHLLRGKKLAFIGDSVARNQFESLLCFLSQVPSLPLCFSLFLSVSSKWVFLIALILCMRLIVKRNWKSL